MRRFFLLGYWRPHEQFQRWLEQELLSFLPEQEKQIRFYAGILEKVFVLDLDRLLTLALSQYSYTDRPVCRQAGRPKTNRRFTKTPRGSEAWEKAFAKRTTVERTINRILVDYDVEASGQKSAGFGQRLWPR